MTVTDENGKFRFDGVGGGDYVVSADSKVFSHVRLPSSAVDPSANAGAEVTFKLEPKAPVAATAVASREQAPASNRGRFGKWHGRRISGQTAIACSGSDDKTQEDVAITAFPSPVRSRYVGQFFGPPKAPKVKAHEVESSSR